jgi:hypothetical protein
MDAVGRIAQQPGDLGRHITRDVADRVEEGDAPRCGAPTQKGGGQVPEHRQAGCDAEHRNAECRQGLSRVWGDQAAIASC